MKQPELGRKISELRKAKGLTQEELVEKCKISVRTIQRIETGEVSPRIYTVKTILAALDYDLSEVSENDGNIMDSLTKRLKNLFFIDIDINKPSDYLIKQLNIALIFGIFYFILGFFEGAAEYFRYEENKMIFSATFYVIMKILVLITYVYFQRGFIVIGGLFNNYLLKISSFILICATIVMIVYDIASIFYNALEHDFIFGGIALTFGGIGIIYGVSIYRLRQSIGEITKYAGIFEIIAGFFFLTIVFSFIGEFVLIPAELFEIIIIYKSIEIIKSKQEKSNLI